MLALCLPMAAARADDGGWQVAWQFPVETPPPFSPQELDAAVAIRRPAGGDGTRATTVAIGWAGEGVVHASTSQRRRAVALAGARGDEAARLVALAIVDVVRPLALPEPLTATGRADEAAVVGERPLRLPGEVASRAGRLTLALSGAVNRGATSAGFALEPTATAAWRLAGAAGGTEVGMLAELGYGRGQGRVGTDSLVVHLAPLRLGVFGRRAGWSITLAALARGYRTVGLSGAIAPSPVTGVLRGPSTASAGAPVMGVLLGGHLGVQRTWGLSQDVGLRLAGGLDLLASGVDFRVRGQSLLRTGRLVPSVALGLLWGAR
jgi:hypothetical protein